MRNRTTCESMLIHTHRRTRSPGLSRLVLRLGRPRPNGALVPICTINVPRCQAGVLARYYPRAPGAAAANPIVGGCSIRMRPSLVTRSGARTRGPRRPYAFRGINTIGKAEGGDAKHGHLPLESRRAFRRLREPDFSPARGNLPIRSCSARSARRFGAPRRAR